MSTDDLTARVRDHLAHADTLPHGLAIALIRELADEVDRLRGENAYLRHISDTYDEVMPLLGQTTIERDAARAALERVRELVASAELAAPFEKPPYWTSHILNALEGES